MIYILCSIYNLSSWILVFTNQKSADDTSNFDSEFTHEVPKLTPIDRLFLMNLDQTEFEGFSFVNPEYVQEC
uniref:AGC-kinase C-terminal domain-containing protein n=1 Tax=Caenorhabditis tropicalis TaxID=1561998 RepID=A0A1I7TZS7_9PELO